MVIRLVIDPKSAIGRRRTAATMTPTSSKGGLRIVTKIRNYLNGANCNTVHNVIYNKSFKAEGQSGKIFCGKEFI